MTDHHDGIHCVADDSLMDCSPQASPPVEWACVHGLGALKGCGVFQVWPRFARDECFEKARLCAPQPALEGSYSPSSDWGLPLVKGTEVK